MIIAEIGLNHKGSEKRAQDILKKLVKTRVDAITFQVIDRSFYKKIKKWGRPLKKEFYKFAIDFGHKSKKKIGFAVTDQNMVEFLDKNGADFWKLLSRYTSKKSLLKKLIKTNKPLFLSTGTLNEQEIIKFSKELQNVRFIHTHLSQNIEDSNLNAITKLKKITKRKIAFGLHCSDLKVLYMSLAFSPSDIFFYVKENKKEEYPDDKHAVNIDKVNDLLTNLVKLKRALGSGIKKGEINK